MQRHAAQFMLVLLVLGLLLLLESRQEFGSSIDDRYVHWLAANAGRNAPAAPLVLVEINESSLGEKHSWPWTPLDYALFFQAILPLKPAVVAVEPVLDWDKNQFSKEEQARLPQYETILHNHLLSAPKAVLGAQLGIPADPDVLPPMLPVPLIRSVQGSRNEIPEFTDVAGQPMEALRLAATIGFTNLPAPGTALRKIPLLFRYRGEVVPSFVLQALMLWLKLPPEQISVETGSRITLGDKTVIPVDPTGAMWVDFESSFTRYGCDELLLAVSLQSAKQSVDIPLAGIKDGITLLARTDAAARVFNFPGNRRGSSGELMAAAIATIQNQAFIRRVPRSFDAAILLGLVTLGWILSRKSKGASATLCLVLLTVYLLGSMMIFQSARIWLPVFLPVSLLLFALFYRLCGHSAENERGKERD
jgi:CHASE2 domain-containing sensor protein